MSDRKVEQASALAALKASHEAQIEALTAPGLSKEERVARFARAAGFTDDWWSFCFSRLQGGLSPALAVWFIGECPDSLFAYLPGGECCPVKLVAEVMYSEPPRVPGRDLSAVPVNGARVDLRGIPAVLGGSWSPDRATLEVFARAQQQARFPEQAGA